MDDTTKYLIEQSSAIARMEAKLDGFISRIEVIEGQNVNRCEDCPAMQKAKGDEKRIDDLEVRVHALEDAPKTLAFNTVKAIAQKIGWAVLGVVGAILIYVLVLHPESLKAIFMK